MDVTKSIRVSLDEDDFKTLSKVAAAEKLPKVEILRRGMRAYARALKSKSRKQSTTERRVA